MRQAVALALAFVLAMAGVVGLAQSARADAGVNVNVALNGDGNYGDVLIVKEGDTVSVGVTYGQDTVPGSAHTIQLFGNISWNEVDLEGNENIQSVVFDSATKTATITFSQNLEANQGELTLEFTIDGVDESSHETIGWIVDGQETTHEVIVRNEGDQFENVSAGSSKGLQGNLSQYVSIDDDGNVTLGDGAIAQELTYTLTLNSEEARSGYAIGDELPEGLSYVADSFSAQITTWDEDGLNRSTDSFDFTPTISGDSFSGTVDLPGPDARDADGASILTITYKATITDEAARVALQDKLQTAYNDLGEEYGNFGFNLTNTATFGGDDEKTANVWLGGHKASPPAPVGPQPWNAFGKDASWTDYERPLAHDEVAEDGTLATPLDITYTLTADLSRLLANDETDFVLDQDVVVEDTLPAQLSWNTSDAEFLSADGLTLSEAGADCDLATFGENSAPGDWCVDGQTLLVNVGQDEDAETPISIAAKAQLTTVDGLGDGGWTSIEGAAKYVFRNEASFHWGGNSPHTPGYDSYLVVLPEKGDDGFRDESAFSKNGPSGTTKVDRGETFTADYTFKVAGGTDYDVTKSHIVDYVDTEVFDLSDLDSIGVSGTYAWSTTLGAEDFTLGQDADGNLTIALSEAGVAKVTGDVNKQWEVTVTLTTYPFDEDVKETMILKNKATLFGEDDNALYWSETSSEATSYGNEAEVRKRVYDRADSEWVETLDAATDAEGALVQDTYVYRIEFLPRGSYGQSGTTKILNVTDTLPDAVDFLGFVSEEDAATGENTTEGPVDIGGDIAAEFTDGEVILYQKDGTTLNPNAEIAAYFAVKITNAEAPIVNKIGTTEAVIVPQDPPSIDIEKWTDEGEGSGPAYDESGALTNDGYAGDFDDAPGKALDAATAQEINFTVSNDGGEALENVVVSDELAGGAGAIENLVCTFPDETTGTTWDGPFEPAAQFECIGTLPGLNAGQTHADTAKVTGVGIVSGDEVTDSDDWNGYVKSYAVGDYTWIDTNRNGIQDEGEKVLPGVTVELLDENGDVIDDAVTDAEGRYLFDDLPAGTYQVRFTLTEDQAAIYQFTQAGAGGDDAVDSDAAVSTGLTQTFVLDDSNEALTTDYDRDVAATQGVDPTWDAGVNLKSVSVGDYVWVDNNRDGIQDEGEPGIPEVTLCLVGPDGEPVVDVFGNPVEPVVTGENGEYTFENLPVLLGDDVYTVCIDPEASAEVLKPYVPTIPGAGDDRGVDSSTWEASSEPGGLSEDGDRDPTLDFGFVVKSYAIGDYTWIDVNRDGIQDEGEKVLPDVTVELTDADGEPVVDVYGNEVAPTVTDAEGRYLFDDLPAGTYQVKFTLTDEQAAIYQFTLANAGENDGLDSDSDVTTGWTETFVLDDSNESLTTDYDREFGATQGVDPTWDSGVNLKSVSVGDYVWVDNNRDGIQDEGEPGIPGVTICLVGPDGEPVTDVFGNPVEPVVTGENGEYTFENLPVLLGDDVYTVCIDREASAEALKPYVPTTEGAGDDRGVDSSTWEASSEPGGLSEDGDRDPTLDFGFVVKSYAIGDYTWIDENKNGIQDEGEPVLPGVTVELTDAGGEPVVDVYGNEVAPTVTDEQGRYLFDNLPAGTYQVKFTLTDEQAAIYQFTVVGAGGNGGLDSDADQTSGWTQTFVLDDSNESLTTDYDREFGATQGIDPTWDAGVSLTPVPAPSETPTEPGRIPDTGSNAPIGAVVAALALLGMGGVLLMGRRRQVL